MCCTCFCKGNGRCLFDMLSDFLSSVFSCFLCLFHSIKNVWNLQIWVVVCFFLSFGWEVCTSKQFCFNRYIFNVFRVIIPLCWLCSVIIHVHVTLSPLLLLVDQFVCHTEAIADIVILVDGSWSIGRLNFRLVRMFLENLVNAFDVGIDKTRIGGSATFILEQMGAPWDQ